MKGGVKGGAKERVGGRGWMQGLEGGVKGATRRRGWIMFMIEEMRWRE